MFRFQRIQILSLVVLLSLCSLAEAQQRHNSWSSSRLPENIEKVSNIVYGEDAGEKLKLDLYRPIDAEKPVPLVIWIHGGGWTKGSKARVVPCVMDLLDYGYSVASIDYSLDGLASHPKQIHQCKAAVRFLRGNCEKYNIDPESIGVSGGSAGGHLSLLLALSSGVEYLEGTIGDFTDVSSKVQAVVSFYGPTDFERLSKRSRGFRRGHLFDMERIKSASPISHISPDDPPLLHLQGSRDTLVPPSQAEALHEAYLEAGLESKLDIIDGAGHGGPEFSTQKYRKMVRVFFDSHLKNKSAKTDDKKLSGLVWIAGSARMLGTNEVQFNRYLKRLQKNLQSNPYIDAVYIHAHWDDIERAENVFDFDRLDRIVEIVKASGRDYKLAVLPGIHTPEFVYKNGAESFKTNVSNRYRPDFGEEVNIPLPWDGVYNRYFTRMIGRLSDRFAKDEKCVAVTVTGVNFMSPEFHLPRSGQDMNKWQQYPQYQKRLIKMWCNYIDLFAENFPHQKLCLELALPMQGMQAGVEEIINYALGKYPNRLALQSDQLNGRNDNSGIFSYPLLQKYSARVCNGFQTVAGWQSDAIAQRQGSMEQTMENFKRADAEYLEIWHGDGMDVDLCRRFRGLIGKK